MVFLYFLSHYHPCPRINLCCPHSLYYNEPLKTHLIPVHLISEALKIQVSLNTVCCICSLRPQLQGFFQMVNCILTSRVFSPPLSAGLHPLPATLLTLGLWLCRCIIITIAYHRILSASQFSGRIIIALIDLGVFPKRLIQ